MRRLTPSGSRPTSMPPTVAVPLVGFSSPHSMRIVVDLPAPLLPRKPKTSPCRDLERQAVDGDEVAEALRQIGDGDGVHRPSARASRASARCALAIACVRSSSACSSATCASSTSVLVATPAAKRSPTTRRASVGAADAVVGGVDRGAARVDLAAAAGGSRRASDASKSASRACGRARRAPRSRATSLRARPPSNSGQLTLTLASHEVRQALPCGKDARVRVGVVEAAARRRPSASVPAAAARPRSPAALDALRPARHARDAAWRAVVDQRLE